MKTPIVFAINESYYKQLETVIVSILENSQILSLSFYLRGFRNFAKMQLERL